MKHALLLAFLILTLLSPITPQDRGLSIVARQITGQENFEVGKQYALIIGIDRYQQWMPLKNAVAEGKALKQVLASNYYIDEFIELYDEEATAVNIRRLFSQTLPAKLGVHDSLLIFYAGHGHLDESRSGFWIPVDGGMDTLAQDRWLPNSQLRNYLSQLKAQRILVMADSCFSGDLLNTTRSASPTIDSAYFKRALQLTSRQVLSSGASETVPDDSEFARQLLGYLERNTEPVIDTLSIYERIRTGMTQTLPLYGTLTGNENGASFVLFRKPKGSGESPSIAENQPNSANPPASNTPSELAFRYSSLQIREQSLTEKLGLMRTSSQTTRTISTAGWITGGLGAALAIGSYVWGEAARSTYDAATSAAVASDARLQATSANTLFNIGLISGSTGLLTGLITLLLSPDDTELERELNQIKRELRDMESQK